MTYPLINRTVTRTHGANVDAFSSAFVGLPVALFCYLANDDSAATVKAFSWFAQVWMFVYLVALGPVPHFLGGMPALAWKLRWRSSAARGRASHVVTLEMDGSVQTFAQDRET